MVLPPDIRKGRDRAMHRFSREENRGPSTRSDKEMISEVRLKGWGRAIQGKRRERRQKHDRMGRHVLTLFTLGELILLLLSFPLPVNCSFTATSCQSEPEGNCIRDTLRSITSESKP